MTDDIKKLVDEWLPGFIPSSDLERFAAAVREAVMASAEVCRGRCGGRGHVLNSLDSVEPTSPCPTCSGRGILFGRGVVEGET